MEKVDVIVIGAGVIGLACGRALALAGREVLLLESESAFGTGVSSRNNTSRPASASARPQARPITPAPIMMTSTFSISPRYGALRKDAEKIA